MEIGIIGLPGCGKTTIFNAVTKGTVSVAGYSDKPNVGVAKVPDERLDTLANMYNPRKIVPAEVTYTDIPPPSDDVGRTRGISGEYLNALQAVDALLVVVRGFENPSVSHIDETIDPMRDVENMLLEMTFSDLDILDRRLSRVEDSLKSAKPQERESIKRELDVLLNVKENLDQGVALRDQDLSTDETKRLSGFGFLSTKPIIIVINISENQLEESSILTEQLSTAVSGDRVRTAVICAQLEMDLAQMDSQDEQDFREDLGTGESSLNKMVRLSYEAVDQVSFFTVGEDEVRAWEIRRNTIAQKAAGKIHTDLERGFIRAEVIPFSDLVDCGSLGEARKRGILRQEGKDYIVRDGEIMHVLFNV